MLDYSNFAATPAASVFDKVFKPGELTLGLLTPLEGYPRSDTPTMRNLTALATLADELGLRRFGSEMCPSGILLSAMWARSMILCLCRLACRGDAIHCDQYRRCRAPSARWLFACRLKHAGVEPACERNHGGARRVCASAVYLVAS